MEKTSNKPKVTVIVPVYKVERYLAQCLNSIINQTLKDIEIIIVDEGDKDRCREIIDYYEKHDRRIVAPHQKNGGYGASCNLGIKMAKGEYIAIVESDDFIEPEMYEEMYNYAKKLDADVVKTPYYEYYSNGVKRDCNYRRYMREVTPKDMLFSVKEYGDLLSVHASLWAAIYKTSYMREKNIQFIKAKGGAYVDVGFRIDTLINTDKIAWLDKPYYNYRIDSEGSTTNNFNLSKMIVRWQEVHNTINQDDYKNYYGRYSVLDEYLNTLGWIRVIKASDEDVKAIADNFKNIDEDVVVNSPVLDKYQKNDILEFKKDPVKFAKRRKIKRIYHNAVPFVLNFISKAINFKMLVMYFIMFITSFIVNLLTSGFLHMISNIFCWCFIIFTYFYLFIFLTYFLLRIIIQFYRKLKNKRI